MIKLLLKRLLWPPNIYRAVKASGKSKTSKHKNDPQLALYDKILGTGFLHYGYFSDPDLKPEQMSLDDIRQAQLKYAQIILGQIINTQGPVLDAGCGMGGLIGLLKEKKTPCVGLTPDKRQISYITSKYPDINLINEKFENISVTDYEHYFDTIIHSESLQYINLEKAIENVLKIMKPDGRWIVVDYFRFSHAYEKSGHQWSDFQKILENNNLKIVYHKDITPNIKPTLAYIHMWGNNIGIPVFEYLIEKLKTKHPGKHYLLEDIIEQIDHKIEKNLNIVDPAIFTRQKKYFLLSIELNE